MKSRHLLVLALALGVSVWAAEKKPAKAPNQKTAAKKLAAKAAAAAPQYKIGVYPPYGIDVPPAVRAELGAGAAKLGAEIESLRTLFKGNARMTDLLPDVQIFHNAVRYALEDNIFYRTNEFASARALLATGTERAAQLRAGRTPWTTNTGNVVRGYVSKLDGSVQPYGLVVPAEFKPAAKTKHRLDFWFHGRGDTLSEVNFVNGRMSPTARSEFLPTNTFVLHPYGRFMNAFKFAGEVDAFEALEHVKKNYPIDDARVSVRGFSMGGAATWHLGAHHAGLWAGVNPGAGFTDVWVYQKIAEKDPKPAWYEQKLWRLYDATNYAANYFNSTLIAYSGEEDAQKQAADLMERALAAEGMKMTHIIGPKTGHKYEPKAREEVAALMDAAAAKGREPLPKKVRFVLFSLRFNQMEWVTVDGLEKHWERSTVEADYDGTTAKVATRGVTGLTLALPPTSAVTLDGVQFPASKAPLAFVRTAGKWERATGAAPAALAKRPGLQGPIDDAFMDSFLFVEPSGMSASPKSAAWATDEFHYAKTQWRRQHRGEPRVKRDTAVTDADIAAHNLILFGDPRSNRLLARIADKLPITWTAKGILAEGKYWDPEKYAPAFIFPNPVNPKRYVVINSGFTFALVGGASNSQQTPKLPDWAILDLNVARTNRIEAGVADANFFNEQWQIPLGVR